MLTILFIVGLFLSTILMYLEKDDWVIAYETTEKNVADAQTIHYLLKGSNIKTAYGYRMNKQNISFTFHKYQEGTFFIKVPKEDEMIAKEAILHFTILKRQKERSVIQDI